LDPEFCVSQSLGETILHSKGTKVSHIARTGRLTFDYVDQFPDGSRDPEKQFYFILNKLKNIKGKLSKDFNVDSARLQLSIYYDEPLGDGEVEFFIPNDLQIELIKHQIEFGVTVIP
jgi:hypothetical protein